MKKNCKKTCNLSENIIHDKLCEQNINNCDTSDFMKKYCKKTCNIQTLPTSTSDLTIPNNQKHPPYFKQYPIPDKKTRRKYLLFWYWKK